jgi:lactate permease
MDNSLVDVVSALFSLLVMVAFLKIWRPANVLRADGGAVVTSIPRHSTSVVLRGWSPFLLASVFIFIAGYPAINKYPDAPFVEARRCRGCTIWCCGFHRLRRISPEAAIVDWNLLSLPGTAIFIGTILALDLSRAVAWTRPVGIFRPHLPGARCPRSPRSALHGRAGLCDTATAGMDTVMGLSLTKTGMLYPFFGTMLRLAPGWR